jgi:kynurenine formamidase
MAIIDITGPVREGMWSFGFPNGQFKLRPLNYQFMGAEYFHEGLDGLVGSTGTFLETGATKLGYDKAISVDRIPLDKLVNVNAYVLQTPLSSLKEKDGRKFISLEDLRQAVKGKIKPRSAILVGTGHGSNWMSKDYLAQSPFFQKAAIDYLLDQDPVLIGSDFPDWENVKNLEGFLDRMYASGVVVLVSCVNLEQIKKFQVRLCALPIKVLKVCMCPARAVIIE